MRPLMIAAVVLMLTCTLTRDAHSLGAFAAYWNGDDTESGAGFGAKWRFVRLPLVGADVRASWLRFGDSKLNLVPLEATGYVDLGLLYGGLGVGYYIFDDADNGTGTYLLLGGKIAPGGFGVFGELKYTWVGSKVGDADLGASGPSLNIGVLFGW